MRPKLVEGTGITLLLDVSSIASLSDIISDGDKLLDVTMVVGEMPLNISLIVDVTAVVGINDLLLGV